MDSFSSAFPGLYVRARTLAFRLLGDFGDAEDAAAEAMVRTLKQWPRVGSLPHRDAWVLRVTTNVALDMARKRRRSEAAADVPPAESTAPSDVEIIALRSALVAALCTLPRRQREAIVLVHLVGLPPTQVATAMSVSQSSVAAHVRRGLDRLRDELRDPVEPNLLTGAFN